MAGTHAGYKRNMPSWDQLRLLIAFTALSAVSSLDGNNFVSSQQCTPFTLRLRGGAAVQNPRTLSSSATPNPAVDDTAFVKIVWKGKNSGDSPPRQVEICGSWSSFKARHGLTRTPNGDWEIIMELPKGVHQLKFVVDQQWKINPDMEHKTDPAGNQNNIVVVDSAIRPSRQAQLKEKLQAVLVPASGSIDPSKHCCKSGVMSRDWGEGLQQKEKPHAVFVPASESIDIAKDMVHRLEQEQKLTQEKLCKAQAQLVETIKIEMAEGVKALQKGLSQVATYAEKGTAGLTAVKASGSAKISEIQSHMAKIRAILDQKESVAIAAVTENLTKRVAKLESEMQLYHQTQPKLQTLMEEATTLLKMSASDGQAFVTASQKLLPSIEKATLEASSLTAPTDNASFDSLQLNLLPPTS